MSHHEGLCHDGYGCNLGRPLGLPVPLVGVGCALPLSLRPSPLPLPGGLPRRLGSPLGVEDRPGISIMSVSILPKLPIEDREENCPVTVPLRPAPLLLAGIVLGVSLIAGKLSLFFF